MMAILKGRVNGRKEINTIRDLFRGQSGWRGYRWRKEEQCFYRLTAWLGNQITGNSM
jgi:hypothetical protein